MRGGRRQSSRRDSKVPRSSVIATPSRDGGQASPLPDLATLFHDLNEQFFEHEIPPIVPTWSKRLTRAAGLFWWKQKPQQPVEYGIRLSLPLLGERPLSDLKATLAHEMIHAWVSLHLEDLNHGHGVFFKTKMAQLNRQTDEFEVTQYHPFVDEVRQQAKYRWDCVECGAVYRRQRNSIDPRKHRCGRCRGKLRAVAL